MKTFLQTVAWWADTVLNVCWPQETEPSLFDLNAAAKLAEEEASEEVSAPRNVGSAVNYWQSADWPEQPDQLGHIVALLEDIRALMYLSVPVGPEAAPQQPEVEFTTVFGKPAK